MTEDNVTTTPLSDRPLTAEDVALLREGDLLRIVPGRTGAGELRTVRRVTHDGRIAEVEDQHYGYYPDCYVFVCRPTANVETGASEGGVTSGAGEVVACSRCGGVNLMMCDCSLPTPSPPVQLSERERALEGVRQAAVVAKNMADNASFNLNQTGLTPDTATCDRSFLDIYRVLEAALTRTTGEG